MVKFEFYQEGIGDVSAKMKQIFAEDADVTQAEAVEFPALALANRAEMIFGLRCPDATRLLMVGAAVGGVSLTGVGETWRDAAQRLLGEIAELTAVERLQNGSPSTPAIDLVTGRSTEISTLELTSDVAPLSEGCAAGPTYDAALAHGTLELIERDATARWWSGEKKAGWINAPPELTRRFRGGAPPGRDTGLLETSHLPGVFCVVAISWDQAGRMFSYGAAADLSQHRAALRALRELHQMETGHHLIRAKVAAGLGDALSAAERMTIRVASEIDCRALLAESVARESAIEQDFDRMQPAFESLREAVAEARISVRIAHLGEVEGLHVIKALSDDLQSSGPADRRLDPSECDNVGLPATRGLPLL